MSEYDEYDSTDYYGENEYPYSDGDDEDDEFESELPDEDMDEEEYRRVRFADPNSDSALYPETENNPRIFPCPTCGEPNVLTQRDVDSHYQCNRCADRDEGKCW
jgi:predicted RNA-binding Zn-ribbon protein involved in translation (DUF1610 family)